MQLARIDGDTRGMNGNSRSKQRHDRLPECRRFDRGPMSNGESDLCLLSSTYACPCDESVMYDEALYPSYAQGMWVWVEGDAEPYLDLVLGYSSNNFGHCHPEIRQAAQDSCARMSQIHSFHTRDKLMLSEYLVSAISNTKPYQVYFDIGGSSVVEGALRLCRAYTGRRVVVSFSGAFHGTGYLAATVTDPALLDKGQYGLGNFDQDVIVLPFPDRRGSVSTADCIALLDHVLAAGNVAGVIIEPIQGAAGFIAPHEDFIPALRKQTAAAEVPLIIDDIQMGVGRTGALYSFTRYGIEPDIVLLSKSLAGGYYPLSALIVDRNLFKAVPTRGTAFQSTFNNNPMGVAIAYAALQIAEHNGYFENAAAQGGKLLEELDFLEDCPAIVNLRGTGLAIAFDVCDKDAMPSRELARRFMHSALHEHVLLYACGIAGNVIKIAPALWMDDCDRSVIVDALALCLARFSNDWL